MKIISVLDAMQIKLFLNKLAEISMFLKSSLLRIVLERIIIHYDLLLHVGGEGKHPEHVHDGEHLLLEGEAGAHLPPPVHGAPGHVRQLDIHTGASGPGTGPETQSILTLSLPE